ncbi:hypothetical protein CF15_01275 [Pyrodictium occultum]|uniref:3-isopropylmalate dehydratase small subunit n=1 Tax=Pyrodictium occultum TaxID=2309 RepID=A0A0V8RX55_PYROC|nr:hypothetical protein CF15_01275 [Pyrodictium occultum]
MVRGRALVVGDNVDTDTIIPARYLHSTDPRELARHVFEDAPGIRARLDGLEKPVVIVAGRGFGYGSSREHAVLALKAAGVAAVVAESFHRIFYRNALNNGLPVVEASLRGSTRDGSLVEIDLETGEIRVDGRLAARARPLPPMLRRLLAAGGLREELRRLAAGSG